MRKIDLNISFAPNMLKYWTFTHIPSKNEFMWKRFSQN